MEFEVLNKRYKELSERLQQAASGDPMLSVLITAMMTLFESLSGMFAEQKSINAEQKIVNEKLLAVIERLEAKLGNKCITVRKTSNENINGKGKDSKRGIDSSSHGKDGKNSKSTSNDSTDIKVTEKEICIDVDGKELSLEEAKKKIGTIFTGRDGKRYKYVRINNSARKTDIELNLIRTQYSKLQAVAVDENGQELTDIRVEPTVYAATDFLKKSSMSINLMSLILEQMLNLKLPLNRISQYLSRYGAKYSRQQLYSYVNIVTAMITPVFKHMESYIGQAKLIGIDETYWECREKQRIKAPPEDEPGKKAQKSKAKTIRSYVFGVITPKVCIYLHSLERNTDIPKQLLLEHDISKDCFIESDAFYKKMFSKIENENGELSKAFIHGICWVHARRNFCELLNYSTHKDGTPVTEMITNCWEQDITDSRYFVDAISKSISIYNDIVKECKDDPALDICKLKNEKVKPLIDEIFTKAQVIYETIKKSRVNGKVKIEPQRKCSDRFYKAMVYLVNNKDGLTAFLDSPYGVMHNNNVEEKFREIDILRNSMMASDTCKGAENLTVLYSLYKTCIVNNTDFKSYMKNIIETMTLHMNEIEFEKDKRGTITDFKSHNISSDVLDKLMPWNVA